MANELNTNNAADRAYMRGQIGLFASDHANTIVTFGDSITANGNRLGGGASIVGTNNMSWFEVANAKAGAPMRLVGNLGVGGETSAQILARVQNVVNLSPKYCTVMAGENDHAVDTAGAFSTFSNLKNIYETLNAAGIYVIALSVLPSTTSLNESKAKIYLNTLLRQYWAGRLGGEYVDLYHVMVDPLQSSSNPIGSPNFVTADGVHPSVNGAWKMGTVLAQVFIRLSNGRPYPLVSTALDNKLLNALSTNICNNPLFTGTTGALVAGVTGTLADRWTVAVGNSATAVLSLIDEPNGYGKIQRCVVTGPNALSSFSLGQTNLAAFDTFTAGNLYEFSAAINITDPVNVANISANLTIGASSVTIFNFANGYANAGLNVSQPGLIYVSMPLVLSATAVGGSLNFGVNFGSQGSGGSVTMDVSRVSINKLN